ncbi:MAG: ABC transporter ATP-binding protein [Dehalococcoidia bacterium]|nr:ABC transporter ATP-binding protein [Dehalococcoidia bacterium]
MRIIWRITKLAAKYRVRLTLAYLSVLGVSAFSMVIPKLLGKAIDAVLSAGDSARLLYLAGAILIASLLRGIFAFGQQYLGESLGQRVAYDLRNTFYDHLQRMSFAFHDKEQTGNLMSKATSDVDGARMFVQTGLIRSVYMASLVVGVGIMMFQLNQQLALLSLALVPFVIWRGGYLVLRLRKEWLAIEDEAGYMNTVLHENLMGQRVVKAFAADEYERSKFYHRATNIFYHSYRAEMLQASNGGMMTLFHLGTTLLILYVGGRYVIQGVLTPGELAQFIFYMGLLAMPVRMAAWIVNSFSRAISCGQRIFATLDAESPVQERENAVALSRVQGHVRFEDVSFGYDTISPVLNHITFEAEPANVIALVGAPGSGKSTIGHLLPRFYDVTAGRITIDGVDVRDATLASLRANIGIVQQDVFLFTSTIRENIAYGAVGASFEQIVRAAEIAQLHSFIVSLPKGYDTWVGERGITLSGGQRQRLAIARTILLDPPILILDDSTSSVDTETEHLIRRALVEVMKGRTTFVIAHRLSTVKSASLILVMREGQIVQRGTHQELLSHPGPYQEVYDLQLRPQEATLTIGASQEGHRPGLPVEVASASPRENL